MGIYELISLIFRAVEALLLLAIFFGYTRSDRTRPKV
jgi:hypothetical protein